MTASDMTFSILCYENGVDVWLERFKMKQMNNVENDAFEKTASLKYHCPVGTKLNVYNDGWAVVGLQYYEEQLGVVKGIMQNELLWDNMKEHWRTYLRKNKRSSFVHIAASMGGHVDEKSRQENISGEEEENNHDIDLPGEEFDDEE